MPNDHIWFGKSSPRGPWCIWCCCSRANAPTDCPRQQISQRYLDMIEAGQVDYFGGAWVKKQHDEMRVNVMISNDG